VQRRKGRYVVYYILVANFATLRLCEQLNKKFHSKAQRRYGRYSLFPLCELCDSAALPAIKQKISFKGAKDAKNVFYPCYFSAADGSEKPGTGRHSAAYRAEAERK
jgi:hypothetical protein